MKDLEKHSEIDAFLLHVLHAAGNLDDTRDTDSDVRDTENPEDANDTEAEE